MLSLLNEHFHDVYVISLEHAKERQEAIRSELSSHGLEFTFFRGVDGRQFTLDRLDEAGVYSKALNASRRPYPMTLGEIGCTYSVLRICRDAIDRGLSQFVILQDDVRVITENLRHLQDMLDAIPQGWDLLYFGHSHMNMTTPFAVRLKLLSVYPLQVIIGTRDRQSMGRIRRSFRRPFNAWWYHAGRHNGAFAYALSNSGAAKLVDALTPMWAVDDVVFQDLIRDGELIAFSPKLQIFDQRWDLGSDIGNRPAWGNA